MKMLVAAARSKADAVTAKPTCLRGTKPAGEARRLPRTAIAHGSTDLAEGVEHGTGGAGLTAGTLARTTGVTGHIAVDRR
jgi:hypothetical protein